VDEICVIARPHPSDYPCSVAEPFRVTPDADHDYRIIVAQTDDFLGARPADPEDALGDVGHFLAQPPLAVVVLYLTACNMVSFLPPKH
jgi:hypothetical protein